MLEYEAKVLPVESMTKYCWLFEDTDILDHVSMIKFLIITTNEKIDEIRNRSIEIIGEDLEYKYFKRFEFNFIPHDALTTKVIERTGEDMFS